MIKHKLLIIWILLILTIFSIAIVLGPSKRSDIAGSLIVIDLILLCLLCPIVFIDVKRVKDYEKEKEKELELKQAELELKKKELELESQKLQKASVDASHKFCKFCGHKIDIKAIICPYCGSNLSNN